MHYYYIVNIIFTSHGQDFIKRPFDDMEESSIQKVNQQFFIWRKNMKDKLFPHLHIFFFLLFL